MTTTRKSRRDSAVAATVALVVNAAILAALQGLLASRGHDVASDVPMQVVWIADALPRDAAVSPAASIVARAHATRAVVRRPAPIAAGEATAMPASSPAMDVAPSRPMSAVYLQQARQWAQRHPVETEPADMFANRPVALAQQAGSRFHVAGPLSAADALAKVGKLFGGADYATDDCALIRGRIVGLVAGGDIQAVQQDLDYERRHCRP